MLFFRFEVSYNFSVWTFHIWKLCLFFNFYNAIISVLLEDWPQIVTKLWKFKVGSIESSIESTFIMYIYIYIFPTVNMGEISHLTKLHIKWSVFDQIQCTNFINFIHCIILKVKAVLSLLTSWRFALISILYLSRLVKSNLGDIKWYDDFFPLGRGREGAYDDGGAY